MNRGNGSIMHGQRGAVLIVSLILLVVLTLLGVSVMNMTQLEERMAGNSQEVVQAFQTAETGLTLAYNDARDWDLNAPMGSSASQIQTFTGRADLATYTIEFIISRDAPPGSGFDPAKFQIVNFDLNSVGNTPNNSSEELHGGAFRMRTKGGGYLE